MNQQLKEIETELMQVYDSIPTEEVLAQLDKSSPYYAEIQKRIKRLNELRDMRHELLSQQ